MGNKVRNILSVAACTAVCLFMGVGTAYADVDINDTNFPDYDFRQFVKHYYDTNYDDKLSTAELNAVTEMEINLLDSEHMKSLKGVEHFTSLKKLTCYNTQLDTLDVGKLTNLEKLRCGGNQLSTLKLGDISGLKELYCGENQLSTLDVGNLTNLEVLVCWDNKLTTLELGDITGLKELWCSGNQLNTLELGNLANLVLFHCDNNLLTELDLSGLNNLQASEYGFGCSPQKVGSVAALPKEGDPNSYIIDIEAAFSGIDYNKLSMPSDSNYTYDGAAHKLTIDKSVGDSGTHYYEYDVQHPNDSAKKMKVEFDWKAEYTVEFNTNGHGVTPAEQKVLSGSTVGNPGDLTEDGYKFGGWYKEAECTNPFDFATEIITDNTTIYAKWTKLHKVIFDANGHGTAPVLQEVEDGGKAQKPAADLTDTGYKFGGWYKEVECTNPFDFDTEVVTADITIYAKWTKKSAGSGSGSGGSGSGGSGGGRSAGGGSAPSTGAWVQDGSGWWYKYSDGNWPANAWKQIKSVWYYFKADGYMATGWQLLSGKWYYLAESVAMLTGWQQISGKWYYLGADGAMATGWQLLSGKWYYLHADGHMAANENIGTYYVDTSGVWIR